MSEKEPLKLSQITNIGDLGDVVGFEMEVEFREMPDGIENINRGNIRVIEDNSLRTGYEFIARGPLLLENAYNAIDKICDYLSDKEVRLSPRTSTHFHLNMLDLNEIEILNTLLLSWYFEEFIKEGVQNHRKENNFCMTIRDSDEFVFTLVDHLKLGGSVAHLPASREYSKYSATNVATLMNIGTMEFRQFHGCIDAKIVKGWLKNLHSMKKFACSFESPLALFEYLFTNTFTEIANKSFDDPEAFSSVSKFDDTNTNMLYISKVVDVFDPEQNLTSTKSRKKKQAIPEWAR